jgi:hypothetical protein
LHGGELQQKLRRPSGPIFEHAILEHVLISGGLMGEHSFAAYDANEWTDDQTG